VRKIAEKFGGGGHVRAVDLQVRNHWKKLRKL
jgi:nanoRNase/pAp phosphatase (c-di-AMP/oligoRNAs hydrolase)